PPIAAGFIYAFAPYRFVHIPQIQLEAMEWMPLALLCLHLFVEQGATRYAVGLAGAVVIGTLCCVYYGVFIVNALLLAMAGLLILDRRAREPRILGRLALVACAVAVLLAPIIGEYLHVHHRSGLERSLSEISARSATAVAYVSSVAPLHQALGPALVPAP